MPHTRTCSIAFATVPPPINGMSVATEQFIERTSGDVKWTAFSVGRNSRNRLRGQLSRLLRNVIALTRLATMHRQRVDSVYMPVSAGFTMTYDIVVAFVCQMRSIPLLIHHHSYAYIDRPNLFFRTLNGLLTEKDGQIFLSETMRDCLDQKYQRRSASILLPNSYVLKDNCSQVPQRERQGRSKRPIRIGFLSNITFEKGLRIVIESFEALLQSCEVGCDSGATFELHLAGPIQPTGEVEYIADAQRRLDRHLVVHGPLYGDEKTAFYQSLDVFWFPTQYAVEAQPIVLVEALRHGVPCVAIQRGCIRWLLSDVGIVADDPSSFKEQSINFALKLGANPDQDIQREASRQRFQELRNMESTGLSDAVSFLRIVRKPKSLNNY